MVRAHYAGAVTLDVTQVVDAAHRILESYGLGDLTMRRVADELGVKAGALYYHVPNKQTLLAKVADVLLADRVTPTSGEPGQWVADWAIALRRALMSTRDGAELVASALATGLVHVDPADELAGHLAAHMDEDRALAVAGALMHFVLGHVQQEQSREQFARLGVVESSDMAAAWFDIGLEVFVRGLDLPTAD